MVIQQSGNQSQPRKQQQIHNGPYTVAATQPTPSLVVSFWRFFSLTPSTSPCSSCFTPICKHTYHVYSWLPAGLWRNCRPYVYLIMSLTLGMPSGPLRPVSKTVVRSVLHTYCDDPYGESSFHFPLKISSSTKQVQVSQSLNKKRYFGQFS